MKTTSLRQHSHMPTSQNQWLKYSTMRTYILGFAKHIVYTALLVLLLTTLLLLQTNRGEAKEVFVTKTTPDLASIVGGEPATPGEWPWQAVVTAGPYFCAGVLIHAEWLITAAHCVYDDNKQPYPPTAFQVILGDTYLYTAETAEQHLSVDQLYPHPEFASSTNDNDIALLHLATPALINNYVTPIPLLTSPEHDALVAPGTMGTVTGWGATREGGGLSATLLEVSVPIIDNGLCQQSYAMLTSNMLCAGYAEGGKDACQGDSGGPLMVPDPQGGWKLAGIVSFGYGCAQPTFYGVYTRISQYVEWIKQTTGPLPTALAIPPVPMATVTPAPTPDLAATLPLTATTVPVTMLGEASINQNFLPLIWR